MRPNQIQTCLQARQTILNGWLSIPSAYCAEAMGHAGFHAVTVDMQHGMIDFAQALHMLQALSATPATPVIRVSALDGPEIMRALDAGAYAVICPMISTAAEAAALVSACRYPPLGTRSFGPARGLLYGGPDYVARANDTLLPIPMIETVAGVENIDAILAVAGIEMIYIGPNDTAFAFDGTVTGPRPRAEAAIAHVLERAQRAGIAVGIYCSDAAEAHRRRAQGFAMVTPGSDMSLLRAAAKDALAQLSQPPQIPAPRAPATGY